MKKFHKKSIVLLAALTLLLTFTVSGTVAFLSVSSGPVTNTFTPAKIETDIVEEFDGNVKSSIKVENNGNIDVYVRVGVVGYWMVDNQIVAPWKPEFTAASGWTKASDGWYYYTSKLSPGNSTSELLSAYITDDKPPEGYPDAQLVVTVIHQSIQTEPASAREAANWGWNPGTGN